MTNEKWVTKGITISLAEVEVKKLEKYCTKTGRSITDVIRKLIRKPKVLKKCKIPRSGGRVMSGRHVKLLKITVVIIWIGTIFAYLGWWIGFSTAFGMLCISILGLCHSAAFILLIFRGILIYRNM